MEFILYNFNKYFNLTYQFFQQMLFFPFMVYSQNNFEDMFLGY